MLQRITTAFDRAGKFLRDVRAELLKVNWPNRRETIVYTMVVVVSVVLIAAVIFVFDSALSAGIQVLMRSSFGARAAR